MTPMVMSFEQKLKRKTMQRSDFPGQVKDIEVGSNLLACLKIRNFIKLYVTFYISGQNTKEEKKCLEHNLFI